MALAFGSLAWASNVETWNVRSNAPPFRTIHCWASGKAAFQLLNACWKSSNRALGCGGVLNVFGEIYGVTRLAGVRLRYAKDEHGPPRLIAPVRFVQAGRLSEYRT